MSCPMIEHLCEPCPLKHLATHRIYISSCHTRTRKGYTGRLSLSNGLVGVNLLAVHLPYDIGTRHIGVITVDQRPDVND